MRSSGSIQAVVLGGNNNSAGVNSSSTSSINMKRREWCEDIVSDAGAESKAEERHTRIINTGMLQPIKYLQRHFPPTP